MRQQGHPSALWLFVLCLLIAFGFCNAALVNRTIDDTLGDSATGQAVQYLPDSVWFNQTSCAGCNNVPDASLTFDHTWTAALYLSSVGSMSVNLKFTGTAIYIFFVIPNFAANSGLAQDVLCDFAIDGVTVGNFAHNSDGSGNFGYNTLVFSNTNLDNGDHTFVITTSGADPAIVIFDRAIYTFEDQQLAASQTTDNTQTTTVAVSAPTNTTSDASSLIPFPTGESTNATSTTEAPFYLGPGTATPSIPPIPGGSSQDTGTSASTSRLITIIASTAGGVIFCIFLGVAILLWWRRRKQRLALTRSQGTISSFDLLEPPARPSRMVTSPVSMQNPSSPRQRGPPTPRPLPAAPSQPAFSYPEAGPSMAEMGYGRVIAATQSKPSTTADSTFASAGHGPGSTLSPPSSYRHGRRHGRSSSSVSLSGTETETTPSQSHGHEAESLRIRIPRNAFALAAQGSSSATSATHSPVTRHGAPLPPEQDLAVRQLLYNALAASATSHSHGSSVSLSISGASAASVPYTPTSERSAFVGATPTQARYQRVPYDAVEDERDLWSPPMRVVHVDSGIRISRTLMDLPPGYSPS